MDPSSVFSQTSVWDLVSSLMFVLEVLHEEAFVFSAANQAYWNKSGLSPQSHIGRIVTHQGEIFLVDPFRCREAISSKESVRFEAEAPSELHGKTFYMENVLHPICNAEGKVTHLVGISEDISGRKLMELKWQESEQRFSSLFHCFPEAAFAFNVSGYFVDVNERACVVTGYRKSDLLKMSLDAFVSLDSYGAYREKFNKVMNGEGVQFTVSIIHKTGQQLDVELTVVPVYSGQTVTGGIGIAKDGYQRMKDSEERYKLLVDLCPEPILLYSDGLIVYCNDACVKVLGGKYKNDILGTVFSEYMEQEDYQTFRLWMEEKGEASKRSVTFEFPFYRLDRSRLMVELSAASYSTQQESSVQIIFRDITERKRHELEMLEMNRTLARLSNHDALTGIHNRRYLDYSLEEACRNAVRERRPFSLLLFDIDYFKQFNDHYGHLSGDDCLRSLTRTIQEDIVKFAPEAVFARYGGEEFSILLPGAYNRRAAEVADRLRFLVKDLRIPFHVSPIKPFITVSIGITSILTGEHVSSEQVIRRADLALYRAKNEGRNRAVVY